MYSNLPRSLKQECLVRTKVEEDETVLKKRQKIVETTKPAELAQFKSISDFPLPTALENIFKPSDKPKMAKEGEDDETDRASQRSSKRELGSTELLE